MPNLTASDQRTRESLRTITGGALGSIPQGITTAVRARVKGVKGYINVSRPTRWGNMYTVAEYGNEGACRLYRTWLEFQWRANENGFRDALRALKGRTLGCSGCTAEQIARGECHAAVLARFVDEKFPNAPAPTPQAIHAKHETRDEAGEARKAARAMAGGEGVQR